MTKSRYSDAERYTVPGPRGRPVTVAAPSRRSPQPYLGVHVRRDGEQLWHLAAHYLDDATGFWQICDANDAMVPEALSEERRIRIPEPRR